MDYAQWIERERRLRVRLLMQSPDIRRRGVFKVCRDCKEVCLCHETICPNCGKGSVGEIRMDRAEVARGERIRCHWRFDNLEHKQEAQDD